MLPDCLQNGSCIRANLSALLPRGGQAEQLGQRSKLSSQCDITRKTLPGNGKPLGNRVHLGPGDAGV